MQVHSKIFNHTKAYTTKSKSPLDLTPHPRSFLGIFFFFFLVLTFFFFEFEEDYL